MTTQVIGGDVLTTSQFWSIAGGDAEGVLMSFTADPRNNPNAKTVVESFRKSGYEPDGVTLYAYAAVQTLAEGIKARRQNRSMKVAAALRTAPVPTILGPVNYDLQRAMRKAYASSSIAGMTANIPKWLIKMRLTFPTLVALLLFTAPAYADINIAAVGPITGQDAPTGEQMQRGAEAAVEAINAAGGVLGQKLNLTIKDDACDPRQAVAIANELSGENVFAVIGHMCSGSAIPASKNYNEEGILMISPSATSPALTEQGFDNVFRTCGRDDQQGAVVADLIIKQYKGKNIAVVQDKTAYGQGLADVVKQDLNKAGIHEKLDESVSRGERDYGSLLSKLKENNIDVMFYGGYHTEAGLIVRQMRDQGMKTVFIGGDDLTTKDFWSITGAAGEGAFLSFNTDPRTRPEAADAVKRIRATGFDPEGGTLYSYAAVQVMAEAMTRAGSLKLPKVIAALHQGDYQTVIGTISLDSNGDVTKPDFIIYRWTKGAYLPLEGP